MDNQHNNKLLPALTGLRGIAAICIVLHHYTTYLLPTTGEYVQQFTPFLLKGYLWVDFFFILSGFILAHVYQQTFAKQINKKEYLTFLKARLARIYPLHIITLLFLVALEALRLYLMHTYGIGDTTHPPFTGKHSIESIFSNIFMLQAFHEWSYWNEPAWAISAEWLLYLVAPLLIFLSKRSNKLIDTGVVMVGFLALYLLASRNNGLDFISWRSLVRCSAEVTIGMIAYKILFKRISGDILHNSWITNLLLASTLLTLAIEINHVITVALFVLLICNTAKLQTHTLLTNRFLVFLGTISYSIYMVHWCIRDTLQTLSFSITGKTFFSNNPPTIQTGMLIVCIVVTIILSAICFYRIEQPLRKAINKR